MAIDTIDVAVTSGAWTDLGASPMLVQLKTRGQRVLINLKPIAAALPAPSVFDGAVLDFATDPQEPPDYNITVTAQVFARVVDTGEGAETATIAKLVLA